MSDDGLDGILGGIPVGRRDFIKKVVAGTAFAVPVVASFGMAGPALGHPTTSNQPHGGPGDSCTTPNQTRGYGDDDDCCMTANQTRGGWDDDDDGCRPPRRHHRRHRDDDFGDDDGDRR